MYRNLWAKTAPSHPLWCHLLDVAAVCEALLPRFGGVAPLPDVWTLYLVALHDIGKVDAQFQVKAEPEWAHLVQPLREGGLPFFWSRRHFGTKPVRRNGFKSICNRRTAGASRQRG